MQVVSHPRPAAKHLTRTIRVEEPGLVAISVDGDRDVFEVEEFPLSHRSQETPARGFRCTAFGGQQLHIMLATDGSGDDVCTCDEFAHRATCLHALGFKALLKRGQLDNVPSALRR